MTRMDRDITELRQSHGLSCEVLDALRAQESRFQARLQSQPLRDQPPVEPGPELGSEDPLWGHVLSGPARPGPSPGSDTKQALVVPSAQLAHIVAMFSCPSDSPVCRSCAGQLPESLRATVRPAGPLAACGLCGVRLLRAEAFTRPFCEFLTDNPTVFHVVGGLEAQLADAGYVALSPRDAWAGRVEPGGRYYTTRNGSSLVAFKVGRNFEPGNGLAIIAGHIDAITARLKPVSRKPERLGYVQLGVAPYAGGLNPTWWDRDLSIGGRVVVRDGDKTSTRLVKLDWPVARIPTLAPHFGAGFMGSNNKETQLVPIVGLDGTPVDNGPAERVPGSPMSVRSLGTDTAFSVTSAGADPNASFVSRQPPRLVHHISQALGLDAPSDIVDWDLELFDLQPATVGGLDKEFIFAGRIDDKLCSWAALQALLLSGGDSDDSSDDSSVIKMVALFDDEEVGSLLRQGARGNYLPLTVERVIEALCSSSSSSGGPTFGPGLLGQTYSRSFLISADVIHAVNPNFADQYQAEHVPRLNVGPVLAVDSSAHFTTDAVSTAVVRRVAELAGSTMQTFQIRNDSRSGGTIGPALSAAMGVKAADLGMPQLSMHSIRATTGALDPGLGVKFFRGFLDHWEKVDAEWESK